VSFKRFLGGFNHVVDSCVRGIDLFHHSRLDLFDLIVRRKAQAIDGWELVDHAIDELHVGTFVDQLEEDIATLKQQQVRVFLFHLFVSV
jgi:hypothetical protein